MQVNLSAIDLIVVGGISTDLATSVADYERRLGRYVRFAVHELKGIPLQRGEAAVIAEENTRIAATIASISKGETTHERALIVCDSSGDQVTSVEFAKRLFAWQRATIVIGGAAGLDRAFVQGADAVISFGRITLPHQIARLVCTEQLYRAFRIARGEPYHL